MSSWFISPWEATRFSLEAQRQIALLFFPFASRNSPGYRLLGRSSDAPAIEENCPGKNCSGSQRDGSD
jgi:hypothetical protein